mmetsp:Transcript_10932/g.22780  ORF Transcript_10932/g.22780 Transcript_10932/m.22780 type:complete len:250 (-) Transcript_10932:482-1231(-)
MYLDPRRTRIMCGVLATFLRVYPCSMSPTLPAGMDCAREKRLRRHTSIGEPGCSPAASASTAFGRVGALNSHSPELAALGASQAPPPRGAPAGSSCPSRSAASAWSFRHTPDVVSPLEELPRPPAAWAGGSWRESCEGARAMSGERATGGLDRGGIRGLTMLKAGLACKRAAFGLTFSLSTVSDSSKLLAPPVLKEKRERRPPHAANSCSSCTDDLRFFSLDSPSCSTFKRRICIDGLRRMLHSVDLLC